MKLFKTFSLDTKTIFCGAIPTVCRSDAAYQIAQVYAYCGESDKSFEWLERAYRQRDAGLPETKTDSLLKKPTPRP